MQPEERDVAYLWDMLHAAREIIEMVQGIDYMGFVSSKVLRYAVERQILIVGEAARNVSPSLKASHPEIPWKNIIGQRNVLVHEYGEILVERIWRVATDHVPTLIRLLEPLIPPLSEEG